ncbi:hypothetical protein JT24_04470 [Xylella fastidiosa]|uniref:Uncharacterized protein n=2 Tax=Xylella fastidiosa TaxID=2371 RepID=B2IAL1_XYLF2|nr:hypothetical protein XfasM23_0854 [Xylella fastidiosa M23]KGM21002.1 hypothetical protein JT24_04470 [Xylella fastidiosa]
MHKHLNGLLIAACDEEFIRQLWQHYLPMILLHECENRTGVDELAETCRRIVAKSCLHVFQQGLLKTFGSLGLHGDAVKLAITLLYDTLQEIVETWRNRF